jgi:hypothetical protein
MNKKWLPFMILAGVLMGGGAFWFYSRPYDAARLVQTLPPDRALHAYLDLGLLRQSGLLDLIAGSPALEEPEYRRFVDETGFDYRKDLDAVAIAFRDGDRYLSARGRFDWSKLSAYAEKHEGHCDGPLCTLPGSVPGRVISYYMLRRDVLALASSTGPTARDMIGPGSWKDPLAIPAVAVWVSAPPYVFSNTGSLPDGSRSFLSPLAKRARSTYFTLGPGSDAKSFELRMEVTSDTPQSAAELAKQLSDTTDLLVKMLKRDKMTPNPADLSGVLVAGKFQANESKVTGTWPIDRSFVEALAAQPVKE